MTIRESRPAARALLITLCVVLSACASNPAIEEGEPVLVSEQETPEEPQESLPANPGTESDLEEGEVPIAVAQTEPPVDARPAEQLPELVVEAKPRDRHEVIHDLVAEGQALLRGVSLDYVFTGKGKKEILRGRPVAFALWSESKKEWMVAQVEIPRPPVKWRPGGKPIAFRVLTPGITAKHVKGTGAERLMFAFWKDGEPLKVYGRKFPVFDSKLLKRKQWRAVVQTAQPIVYLPFTEDTLDPLFVSGGRDFLLATARQAVEDLRAANVPSVAFPGELMADVVPAEVITTLAVIEQTDDGDYVQKKEGAFHEVLSQYGLKRGEAYRYSVSSAAAIGPMQFTNKRGNGTYAMVVRRCPGARIDPDFERGATNLLNAMKAAICLFDIELAQMRADIREAYRDNKKVLGIFPVAAYNGGPKNVRKLAKVIQRMKVRLDELREPGEQSEDGAVPCPCLWAEDGDGVRPISIPRYNNENRWYIEKYQSILSAF